MACSLYVCLFAIVATVYSQMMDTPIACPENERYYRCVYEVCHKTCEDMRNPHPFCPMMSLTCFNPGCICNIGYLRNNQGVCVTIGECDCPPNEKYYKCSLEVCYKTCQHLKTPPPCPAIAEGCFQPDCVCDMGYLRNDQGLCVPIHECQ